MCKTRIYFTQAEFVANYRERYAIRVWKQHKARHGNVPMVVPCSICSGKERKIDISARPKFYETVVDTNRE